MTRQTTRSCIGLQWVCIFCVFSNVLILYPVLHPRHKLTYFQCAGWAPEWITAAKIIVCDEFDRSYHFRDDIAMAPGPDDTNDTPLAKNIFDNLSAFRTLQSGTLDELTSYLATMPEDVKNEDVLHWWYEHKHVYPNLSRMALDYHAIPCKSLLLFTRAVTHISDYIHSSRYLG